MAKKAKVKEKWRGPYKVLKKILKHAYKIDGRDGKPITVIVEKLKLCRFTKEEVRKQKRFRKQHRLVDKDIEHSQQSGSERDSTESEDSFPNIGIEPCTLMEGLTLDIKQEDINGRELNPEPSDLNDRSSQNNDTGTGDEAETSGTRESQCYFFRLRKNVSYEY